MSRARQLLIDRGILLALVVLAAYVWIAPTTIVDGDNAEFARLGAVGGRAHPSGYPAYVLYLRAMSWLPGASPAHAAALATCLLGALAVLVLHAACRAWGARPAAASVACALYAASPVVLRTHTEAEVFAGNALVVALVLWLAAAEGPVRGVRRAALLGLVAGLGLANHLTCSLVAPVGLYGVARAVREAAAAGHRAGAIGAAVGTLGLGLSAYLYLFVADAPASYGQVDSFGDVLAFFLREDYGGPTAFVPGANEVPATTNLAALAATLGRAYLWLPALAGVAMLGVAIARPRGETRLGWALLAVSFLVAGPLLSLRFNIEPTGLGLYVNQRFHLLPMLLLAIPVAAALSRAVEHPAVAARLARLARPAITTGLALAVFGALVVAALPRLRALHGPAMERGIEHMLRAVPPDGVVVLSSEDVYFGFAYLQHARGLRPDVTPVFWILTSRPWYHRQVVAAGIPLEGRYERQLGSRRAEAILATGRPLLVDHAQKTVIAEHPGYPEGLLLRVLPKGATPPKLTEVVELNRKLFASFDLDYPRPTIHDDFATIAHDRYAGVWFTLARALRAAGNPEAADQANAVGAQLAPEGR